MAEANAGIRQLRDVTCTACGCVCDDLVVTADETRILAWGPPCPLASRWFEQLETEETAVAWLRGEAVELTAAIQRSAELLAQSRAPLIYGLSSSSTPGQRAAIRLADRLGACIDTTASNCHGPSLVALQQIGESTCSLGEIANRADLIIYWGSDPVTSHPRHLERYAWEPEGRFVRSGRAGRRLVVVDVQRTATAQLADWFLPVAPGSDFDHLWRLRSQVREATRMSLSQLEQSPACSTRTENLAETDEQDWDRLVRAMMECRCGVIFFGRGLAQGPTGHANVAALLALVRDLNAHTRFHARRMRIYGDVAGADSVLTWQTGYPFSVNLARGYPRYSPGEYSAESLLTRREVDCCLLLGREGLDSLSASAQTYLQSIPTIVIEHGVTVADWTPEVCMRAGVYGIHLAGTAYRMDEVPIPLRPLVQSAWPADRDILQQISAALDSR